MKSCFLSLSYIQTQNFLQISNYNSYQSVAMKNAKMIITFVSYNYTSRINVVSILNGPGIKAKQLTSHFLKNRVKSQACSKNRLFGIFRDRFTLLHIAARHLSLILGTNQRTNQQTNPNLHSFSLFKVFQFFYFFKKVTALFVFFQLEIHFNFVYLTQSATSPSMVLLRDV